LTGLFQIQILTFFIFQKDLFLVVSGRFSQRNNEHILVLIICFVYLAKDQWKSTNGAAEEMQGYIFIVVPSTDELWMINI